MRKSIVSLVVSVLSIFFVAGSTMALTYGSIPNGATNDLLGTGNTAYGWYGADLYSAADQTLTFTYLGKEASYNNYFEVYDGSSWNTVFTTGGSAVGSTFDLSVGSSELVSFRFLADMGIEGEVTNGTNPDDSGGLASVNFFTTFKAYTINNGAGNNLTTGMVGVWLDDAGAGPDDNHDDMLVGITGKIRSVPEPATMLLFGVGLVGLAGASRRQKLRK